MHANMNKKTFLPGAGFAPDFLYCHVTSLFKRIGSKSDYSDE